MSYPLATFDHLSIHLQQTFNTADAAAEQALQAASAAIRSYTRQHISLVADDEVALRGTWGTTLDLPERPIVDVSSVSSGQAALIPTASWQVVGGHLVNSGGWLGPHTALAVTYTHGFAVIPDDIVAVCVSLAARTFDNPRNLAGEGYEGYSSSLHLYPLELSRTEQGILNRYRRRTW